jgi:hypothetical protein
MYRILRRRRGLQEKSLMPYVPPQCCVDPASACRVVAANTVSLMLLSAEATGPGGS